MAVCMIGDDSAATETICSQKPIMQVYQIFLPMKYIYIQCATMQARVGTSGQYNHDNSLCELLVQIFTTGILILGISRVQF